MQSMVRARAGEFHGPFAEQWPVSGEVLPPAGFCYMAEVHSPASESSMSRASLLLYRHSTISHVPFPTGEAKRAD